MTSINIQLANSISKGVHQNKELSQEKYINDGVVMLHVIKYFFFNFYLISYKIVIKFKKGLFTK